MGDALDSALAAAQIGLYKAELIWPSVPWTDVDHVERETLERVHWFNTQRSHEATDDLTPDTQSKPTTLHESASPRPAETPNEASRIAGAAQTGVGSPRSAYCWRAARISWTWATDQSPMAVVSAPAPTPSSVSAYSTLGGTVG